MPNFYSSFTRNFNPYLGSTKHLHTTQGFIYEPLVIFNEMKGNTPVMRLATEYKFSNNLSSVIFFLRDDVKWSDGQTFNADDVIFSYQLIKQYPSLDKYDINPNIKSVEKISNNIVVFHLSKIDTSMPYQISKVPIVAEHIWKQVQDPTTFTNANPVGTGPFTQIEEFNSELYRQCRNPYYWDAKNLEIDCLNVPQIYDNVQLVMRALKSELDWSSAFIPDIKKLYQSSNSNHHYWNPAAGTQAFMFNFENKNETKNEVLTNVDFRRAFSMAIDRQAIIDTAFYGQGTINDFASGLGYSLESWSDEAIHKKYQSFNSFDLEGAKALLTQAGFIDIDNDGFVESPSGKSFQLVIQSPSGWTDFNNVVQLALHMLEDAGINAKGIEPEFPTYNQSMVNGNYDVAYTNYFQGADPYTYWNSSYNSSLQSGKNMPRFAMHFFKNEQLDTLLNNFYQTADKAQQLDISHQIQQIVAENQVTVPVISGASTYQYNTKRFTGWWNENNPKGRPQIWAETPERLLHVLDLKPVKN